MAGRMGGQQVTTQNVKVMKVDGEKDILVLNGTEFDTTAITTSLTRSDRMYTWTKRLSSEDIGCSPEAVARRATDIAVQSSSAASASCHIEAL